MAAPSSRLQRFMTLPSPAAEEVALEWAAVPSWAAALVGGRPYGSVAELSAAASEASARWTWSEILTALAEHPRIGQRPAEASRGAAASTLEQAASARTDAETQASLRTGNIDYERRFGWVFLIRAAGRPAEEILLELRRRIHNGIEQERAEVRLALRDIALLRIERAFRD